MDGLKDIGIMILTEFVDLHIKMLSEEFCSSDLFKLPMLVDIILLKSFNISYLNYLTMVLIVFDLKN